MTGTVWVVAYPDDHSAPHGWTGHVFRSLRDARSYVERVGIVGLTVRKVTL